MANKSVTVRHVLIVIVLAALVIGGMFIPWDTDAIAERMRTHPVLGVTIYIAALAASVVLLPLSSLPLVPLAVEIFGVLAGALFSIIGWWIGGVIAFLLARYVGRPVLQWFVSLEKLDKFEARLPSDVTFPSIVLLYMVTPTDIPSFALGLLTGIPFPTYAVATFVGITPFAFAWMLLGDAFFEGNWLLFAALAIVMVAAVYGLQRLIKRRRGGQTAAFLL